MQINGSTHVHGPQPLNQPHRLAPNRNVETTYGSTFDQLDISPEGSLVSRALDAPEIRHDRVAQLKAEIASGRYETDEKLDVALGRLLDELGG